MTDNDKALIEDARFCRFNYEYIESLIGKVDTEEAKQRLKTLAYRAFKNDEARIIDFDNNNY